MRSYECYSSDLQKYKEGKIIYNAGSVSLLEGMPYWSRNVPSGRKPIVNVFYTTYCPFCVSFSRIFEKHSKSTECVFTKSDITEDNNPLWEEHNIKVVPTLIAFENGKEIARRDGILGVGLSENDLTSLLREITKTA